MGPGWVAHAVKGGRVSVLAQFALFAGAGLTQTGRSFGLQKWLDAPISEGSAKPCVFTQGVTRLAKKERSMRSKSGAACACQAPGGPLFHARFTAHWTARSGCDWRKEADGVTAARRCHARMPHG